MQERLKSLFAEYGRVAIATYFALFFLVFAGFVTALVLGTQVEGAAGTATLWGGAYLATKLTQPLRILATVVLTPLIATGLKRLRKSLPDSRAP